MAYDDRMSESFRIYYRGGLADDGMLEAEAFAESLLGAAKLYKMLAHYSELGRVPRKRKTFEVYTRAAILGKSVDQELVIQAISYSDLLAGGMVSVLLGELVAALKRYWTKADETTTRELIKTIREEQRLTGRALGIVERLLDEDKFSTIARRTRPHLHDLVSPLRDASCETIVQFPGDRKQILLTQDDAAAIRRENIKRTGVLAIKIGRIRRLNTDTRNCSVVVDDDERGIYRVIFGEIEDETLELPNNEYTRAFNLRLGGLVLAEADAWDGYIVRLYIKGTARN